MSSAILFSEKLRQAGVTHGFTTRRIGDVLGSMRGWEQATGLSGSSVVWLNQVHGNDVLLVDQPATVCSADKDLRYDAAVTDRDDVVLTVRTADCVPILLYSCEPAVVGIVHAGWRGTLSGVVTSAVSMLDTNYGCRPEELIAAIGRASVPAATK